MKKMKVKEVEFECSEHCSDFFYNKISFENFDIMSEDAVAVIYDVIGDVFSALNFSFEGGTIKQNLSRYSKKEQKRMKKVLKRLQNVINVYKISELYISFGNDKFD